MPPSPGASGSSSPGQLVIRADAGPSIGTGHVMRCLAIAQAWRRLGGEATFVTRNLPKGLQQRIESASIRVESLLANHEEINRTIRVAKSAEAKWVVVDSYALGDEHRAQLRAAGLRVLALNDFGPIAIADAVLNTNPQATADDYAQIDRSSLLLLGSRYCLLRKEFVAAPAKPRVIAGKVRRVLITGGGADPTDLTTKALQALASVDAPGLEAVVLIGAANPRRELIERLAREVPVRAQVVFDSPDVAAELRKADVAITAAGSSCWEMAYTGLPMLTVVTAGNQAPVAETISGCGAGINLGWHDRIDTSELMSAIVELVTATTKHRTAMSQASQRLIDGRGAERIAQLLSVPPLTFRPATMDDARLLWNWRNDPAVRSVSLTSDKIPFESHCKWLAGRLERTDCKILVASDAIGQAVGQVRFDGLSSAGRAEISVSLAASSRKKGYGSAIIRLGTEYVLGRGLATTVHAVIKPDNFASQRAFEKAGYVSISKTPTSENVLHYTSEYMPLSHPPLTERAVA